MKQEINSTIERLKEKTFTDTEETDYEKDFERWRNPLYNSVTFTPDASAKKAGISGNFIELFLNFENNRVKDASYRAKGCVSCFICASFIAETVIGKNLDALSKITGDFILNEIELLPKEDEHCAFLAAETLQEILKNNFKQET